MNGIPLPLYPFRSHSNQSTRHPVDRRLHNKNPGAFASHVGGGGSGDCQFLADITCSVVGGGPVNPSGERGVGHRCD